jgi:predicted nucleic acid-binding protein
LLDTNILSEMMKPTPHPEVELWLERHAVDSSLSVLVLAELADGIEALPRGKRQTELAKKLDFLQQDYADQILVFDETCAWEWSRYCQEVRATGQVPALMDSLIAATARVWGLKVVTRNDVDFPCVETVNPFIP